MKRTLSFLGILVCIFLNAQCLHPDHLDLVKIADKVRLAFFSGYWSAWGSVPFTVLLVEDEYEYVLNTHSSDSGFWYGCDSIQVREATLDEQLLATFPLINSEPTIVVGTPANTGKNPGEWVITLLHEHFHQLQFSHPQYFSAQQQLGLDKGDKSDMWMLNHPFPYQQQEVEQLIRKMSHNLLDVYEEDAALSGILEEHLRLKTELKKLVGAEDFRYLNLQFWQEGMARYMEMSLLSDWIENFEQVDQQAIEKNQLQELLTAYHNRLKTDLTSGDLTGMKRAYFYSLGAAEALLIARINQNWKESYFDQLYSTDHLLISH